MLRDSLKIAFCGLAFILGGCGESTHFLVSFAPCSVKPWMESNIRIKTNDPYVEYKVREVLENSLVGYGRQLENYIINIQIYEKSESAIYTEKQVAKEQIRMWTKVEIFDKYYNRISEKVIDSFSTYDVCDEQPFAALSSKNQVRDSVVIDLANSIFLVILESLTFH